MTTKKIIKFKFIFTEKNIPQNFNGERSLKIRLKWNLHSMGFSWLVGFVNGPLARMDEMLNKRRDNSYKLCWAENSRMVDIEINAWSFLFLNLKTNLILYLSSKVYKIQPIRVSYQKPGNLKFCAPFKINIQKREGLSKFEKRFWIFLYNIQKRGD